MKYLLILYFLLPSYIFAQNKSGYNMLFGDQGMHAVFTGDTNKPMVIQSFLPYPILPQRNFDVGHSCIRIKLFFEVLVMYSSVQIDVLSSALVETKANLFVSALIINKKFIKLLCL
jgi:hypothetical protein